MLGMRGCRLGICHPEITRMQVQAIFEAACEVAREGVRVQPEIMIPLVSMVSEMRAQKDIVLQVAEETMKRYKRKIPYSVGAMIELPRAAVTADEIAREADFFSFGTNDLTQTTFGFSRDDAGKFIQNYLSPVGAVPAVRREARQGPLLRVLRRDVPAEDREHPRGRRVLDHRPGGRGGVHPDGRGEGAVHPPDPRSWASAGSTAGSRDRWSSSSGWGSITSPARRTAFPSPGWPRPRRCSGNGWRERQGKSELAG